MVMGVILGVYVMWGWWAYKGGKGEGGKCVGVEVLVRDSAGGQFVTSGEVESLLRLGGVYPVGKEWGEINTEEVEEEVEGHAMVAKAEAYVTLGGKVKVVIWQREPVLRVMGEYGNFYVDREGSLMPVSVRSTAWVPVASGYVEKSRATGGLYKLAVYLREDAFWGAQIEQLYVRRNGEVELVPRVGGHRIILGEVEGYEEKLAKLRAFYEQAIPKFGWGKYKEINLKYRDQVVCRRR